MCYDNGEGLQKLREQVYGGPGVGVVESAVAGLGRLQPWAADSSGRLRQAMRGTGVDWQGQAADATAASVQRVGEWANLGGQATHNGGGRVQDYAGSFAEMKSKIAEPVPVPTLTAWNQVLGIFGNGFDHYAAVEENANRTEAAYTAYRAHENNSRGAVDTFPTLNQVPQLSRAEPAKQPAGPGVSDGDLGWRAAPGHAGANAVPRVGRSGADDVVAGADHTGAGLPGTAGPPAASSSTAPAYTLPSLPQAGGTEIPAGGVSRSPSAPGGLGPGISPGLPPAVPPFLAGGPSGGGYQAGGQGGSTRALLPRPFESSPAPVERGPGTMPTRAAEGPSPGSGPGAMLVTPAGGGGAGGGRRRERDEDLFLRTGNPFEIAEDDAVVSPVIGPEEVQP
ncbi:hypothetical protein BKA01_003217 [Pseudonocardia eucalypti]|nr:hypothetical protein [Pseudonocardia eucalypti]